MKKHPSSRRAVLLTCLWAAAFPATWGAAYVQNPSFESNWNETWPHYGPIDGWTGGSGVNDRSLDAGGPFHDNGRTPDRNRVAFKQQNGPLSQEISGLTAGQPYWIQYFYNSRGDSIGGNCDITTLFAEQELDTVTGVIRVAQAPDATTPFLARTVPFVAPADAGTLTFRVATSGDRTALFDAVTIVPRGPDDFVVLNPSFEASGTLPEVGVLENLAGWTVTGSAGVDVAGGTWANNGTVPDQDLVAFIEGEGSLTQTLRNLVPGTRYEVSVRVNARTGGSPRLQVKAGDTVVIDGDVSPVGGDAAFATRTGSFTPSTDSLVLSIAQTRAGTDALLVDDVRVIGARAVVLPPLVVSPKRAELAPGQTFSVTVQVPTELLAQRAADLRLTTSSTNLLQLSGAGEDGTLLLRFEKGGPSSRTIEATALRRGAASLSVIESAGLEVPNGVLVNITESFVRNPSFEAAAAPEGVGYGEVLGWTTTGGTGVNTAAQPFAANGGVIPDRAQVAFIQGVGALSQSIRGLRPGATYWLQFRSSVRDNPDPNGPATDLVVTFGDQTLLTLTDLQPLSKEGLTDYRTHHVAFQAPSASGELRFATANPRGDASILLDAINLVARDSVDLVIRNASFEASGSVDLYLDGPVEGWEFTGGGKGTDADGPFHNGVVPDQDLAFFMQGAGSLQQKIAGFTAGQKYTLVYQVNARDFPPGQGTTHHVVQIGAEGALSTLVDEDVTPTTGPAGYTEKQVVFTADAAELVLRLEHLPPEGDKTLLLDNLRIVPGENGPPAPAPSLAIGVMGPQIRIAWPVAAEGWTLRSAATVRGPYVPDAAAVVVEGDQNTVLVPTAGEARFYQLSR